VRQHCCAVTRDKNEITLVKCQVSNAKAWNWKYMKLTSQWRETEKRPVWLIAALDHIGPPRTAPDRIGRPRTTLDRLGRHRTASDDIGPHRTTSDRLGPHRSQLHRTIWYRTGQHRTWTEHLDLETARFIVGWLGLGPRLVGRIGSGVQVRASFQKIACLVGRLGRKVIDCK